jgi:hypothetical protein
MILLAAHPELEAPAGGIRPPIARANAWPPRTAEGNRAPAATQSRAQMGADSAHVEHGEDGEDATLPAASTVASFRARWATLHVASTPLPSSPFSVILNPPPSGSGRTSTPEVIHRVEVWRPLRQPE